MPNISAHMIVAKEVGKKININSDDFIRGNILPDIINIENSHHKIQDKIYMIPDIDYFLNILDLNNDLHIGYLTHLLLDKYYLTDYLNKIYPNENIFLDGKIYNDYDYINNLLVRKFNLDINNLVNILSVFDCKINEERLKYNIDCLKQIKIGDTKYLNADDFSEFLLNISDIISKELISYANKSSKLYIRTRK